MIDIEHDDFGIEQLSFMPREDGLAICVSATDLLSQKMLLRLLIPTDKLREYHELCLLRAAVVAGELMPPLPDPIPVDFDLELPDTDLEEKNDLPG